MTDQATNVLGTLGINWKLFLAQLVNFSIVLFVMWKWVYTPLLAMMDKRKQEILDGLKHAKEAKQRLADAQSEKERMLKEARQEAQGMIAETEKKAEALRAQKLVETKNEIEKIVAETKLQIRQERDAAFHSLKSEVADLVTLATTKVVGKLDAETKHELVTEALKDIG